MATIPLEELSVYARELAKKGCEIDPFQFHDFELLEEILKLSEYGRKLFFSEHGKLKRVGDSIAMPDMADFIEIFCREGSRFFYEGEISLLVARDLNERSGHITRKDFESYQLHKKNLSGHEWNNGKVYSAEGASVGSRLLYLLLSKFSEHDHQKNRYLHQAESIKQVYQWAQDYTVLNEKFSQYEIPSIDTQELKTGGTTHFNIQDDKKNAVSITVSNGEGSGIWVPGTCIQLNNMLGEEALLPHGLNTWTPDCRLTSMMTPTVITMDDGRQLVLGTGGAGRIPYMIAQVSESVITDGIDLHSAVERPRVFFHDEVYEIEEPFFETRALNTEINFWSGKNMYFGGVHAIYSNGNHVSAVGDARRYGHAMIRS